MLHERQQLDRSQTAVKAYDIRSQSLQAVSYTHLDVYKRQVYFRTMKRTFWDVDTGFKPSVPSFLIYLSLIHI